MDEKEIVCDTIRADVPTAGGITFTRETLEKVVYQANKASREGTNFVTKEIPLDGRVQLASVVGRVHKTEIRDGQIVCQMQLLETPAAQGLALLLGDGVSIQPILHGTVTATETGRVVNDDVSLTGFSLVYSKPKK